jgi:prepilin-type N-terminal cleavage/methylation domain-containing protein
MLRNLNSKRDFSSGFTLLEVLIAIGILSIGLLGMATLTGSIIGYNRMAREITEATTLAQAKMEELKNEAWGNIQTETEVNLDAAGNDDPRGIYERVTEVEQQGSEQNPYKIVDVTVNWAWKGKTRNIALKTIVAK